MNILNIDLDFFLNEIAIDQSGDERLNSEEFLPWKEEDFRSFLENKCGLSISEKIRGKVITYHDEALSIFSNLFEENSNNQMLLTHIDAHTDLKAGYPNAGLPYLLHKLNNIPIKERANAIDGSHIGPANYLSFAISLNLFSEITFVLHPKFECDDMPVSFFKDSDINSGYIEMKGYDTNDHTLTSPINVDEPIPFHMLSMDDYTFQESYDYLIFCKSPGYTPETADFLINIVKEYLIDVY